MPMSALSQVETISKELVRQTYLHCEEPDQLITQPESTGPPVPICDIRIVDPESKRRLKTGQSGLLQVRGPQVMRCYYNDEGG